MSESVRVKDSREVMSALSEESRRRVLRFCLPSRGTVEFIHCWGSVEGVGLACGCSAGQGGGRGNLSCLAFLCLLSSGAEWMILSRR